MGREHVKPYIRWYGFRLRRDARLQPRTLGVGLPFLSSWGGSAWCLGLGEFKRWQLAYVSPGVSTS
jgi:hypothetical protein